MTLGGMGGASCLGGTPRTCGRCCRFCMGVQGGLPLLVVLVCSALRTDFSELRRFRGYVCSACLRVWVGSFPCLVYGMLWFAILVEGLFCVGFVE
jgi:hypothetical protein